MGSKTEREGDFSLVLEQAVGPPTESPDRGLICGIPPRHCVGRDLGQSALMRAASRDSLRETVFLCSTPLVIARCSSGCAS